jgi:hypothetical protein
MFVPASLASKAGPDNGKWGQRFLLLAVKKPCVDDTALLRQTIRRCTAVLVATLATVGVSLQRSSEVGLLLILAIVSVVYLVVGFIKVNPPAESHRSSSSTEDER